MILDLTKEKRRFLVNVLTCCAVLHMHRFNSNVHALRPEFDTWVSNVTVVSGQEAILPCNVRHLGEHSIVWETSDGTVLTYNGQRITSDTRFRIENPYIQEWNLHINPADVTDADRYRCVINTESSITKDIDLYVQVKPQFVGEYSSPRLITRREGANVVLHCNVTGIPTPTVSWFRVPHDKLKAKERLGHEGSTLVIYNVSRACADTYECVAVNGVRPSIQRSFVLDVKFAPQVTVQPRSILQKLGRTTMLSCTIEGNPLKTNHWEFNGRQLKNHPGKYHILVEFLDAHTVTLSLTISNIEELNYGDYTCVGGNQLGKVKKTATLVREFSATSTRWTETIKPSNDQPQPSVRSTTPLTIPVTDKTRTTSTVASTKTDVNRHTGPVVEPTYKVINPGDNKPNGGVSKPSSEEKKDGNTGPRTSSSVSCLVFVLVIMTVLN